MLAISKAKKSEKKAILRFYKLNHYSARFLGHDTTYLAKVQDEIVASVILSNIVHNANQVFLHGLFTAPNYRNQGYSTQLLKSVCNEHPVIVCFAQPALSGFYQTLGFTPIPATLRTKFLNAHLLLRFNSYVRSQPKLQVFIFEQNNVKTLKK